MLIPSMSSTISVGALTWWMLLLTLKHVVGDFLLQNTWMAKGKDQKTGWALPLIVHCAIHGILTTAIIAVLMPRLWFLGLIDFVIHIAIDRSKGFLVARYNVTPEHQWFWWLIGIDQALHHLTGFGLSIILALNS